MTDKKWWKNEERRVERVEPEGTLLPFGSLMQSAVRWLWPGRIVSENVTLLLGDPDVGKSLMAMDLAARVSTGAEWPDGAPNGKPGGVILLSAEDSSYYTVGPALSAAHANEKRVATVWDVRELMLGEVERRPFQFPKDMRTLEKMIRSMPECKLVVIDPITAFMSRGANMRHTLLQLAVMSGNLHVAILCLAHLKPGGRQAVHRTQGGIALTSAARAVWLATKLPESRSEKVENRENGERRLLLPVKNNLVRERTGLAYRLVAVEGREVPRVEWEKELIMGTADEVLAKERRYGMEAERTLEAAEFLREALAGGPRLTKDVEAEARETIQISKRTLDTARKELKVRAFRTTIPGPWWIKLPPEDVQVGGS